MMKEVPQPLQDLKVELEIKKKELNLLVEEKKSLLDEEVYKKSCELDMLVVQAMRGYLLANRSF